MLINSVYYLNDPSSLTIEALETQPNSTGRQISVCYKERLSFSFHKHCTYCCIQISNLMFAILKRTIKDGPPTVIISNTSK